MSDLYSAFAACCLASVAAAQPVLVITEIWPGGIDGEENNSDWIELTNLGDAPIVNLSDYHFRDNPVPNGVPDGLPLAGGQLTGVETLQPGESAVFLLNWDDVIGTNVNPDLPFAIRAFRDMWGDELVDSIKLGWMVGTNGTGGPGLSRDGDNVIIYDGPVTGSNVVTTESFPSAMFNSFIYNPDTSVFGELAADGVFGAHLGLLPAGTGVTEPYAASPGVIDAPVPVCVGDCDDSGAVDFNDLVSMLFEFGKMADERCDADTSGSVDFNDLVAALFLFGPCP